MAVSTLIPTPSTSSNEDLNAEDDNEYQPDSDEVGEEEETDEDEPSSYNR